MFSASKLYQSLSTCGPSATAKPRSAKIAAISSITWLTGWIVPCGRGARRQGDVGPLAGHPGLERGVGEAGAGLGERLGRGRP